MTRGAGADVAPGRAEAVLRFHQHERVTRRVDEKRVDVVAEDPAARAFADHAQDKFERGAVVSIEIGGAEIAAKMDPNEPFAGGATQIRRVHRCLRIGYEAAVEV